MPSPDARTRREVYHSDRLLMGGTPVFQGTRVPIQALFDYLAGGYPLSEFLESFPTVRREQALALLQFGRDALAADAPVTESEDVVA